MRLGLLGPSGGDIGALGRAAEFLLNTARVHRAIYLGNDGALDRAVAAWARKLVGDDPTDDNAWRRAADVAANGTFEQIDKFVSTERSRMRLKTLETLQARTIEMISDRVAVLVYDKALLDEEDILAANIICFGKNDGPLVKKVGSRWFVSPGTIGSQGGGLAVLDDETDEVVVTVYDSTGKSAQREVLAQTRTAKMRVQGDA